MNPIQEFIEKYNGVYHEEVEKVTYTPQGKYTSQAKWGKLIFQESSITLSIDEIGGADPVTEPFRMVMKLDTATSTELLIYPRSYLGRLLRERFLNNNSPSIQTIHAQYRFTGNKKLRAQLCSMETFRDLIFNEYVCINISRQKPKVVTITPARGYRDLEHLETLASILKIVNNQVCKTVESIR